MSDIFRLLGSEVLDALIIFGIAIAFLLFRRQVISVLMDISRSGREYKGELPWWQGWPRPTERGIHICYWLIIGWGIMWGSIYLFWGLT